MRRARTPFEKYIRDPAEAGLLWAVWGALRLFPIDAASAIGGWLGRTIGPRLPQSALARTNIRIAFPDLSDAEVEKIVVGMWDNLGRVAGEFPHVNTMDLSDESRIKLTGLEHLLYGETTGQAIFYYSAHLGNWELGPTMANHHGIRMISIYRQANNPYVETVYRKSRRNLTGAGLVPKGPEGAREILKHIRDGRTVGMLVDQKMNDGVRVPFFGRDAMTAPALADLARRADSAVIGARVIRKGGAHFEIEVLPPVHVEKTDDKDADILRFMTQVNQQIEDWIRERPEQWLWLHNRWPGRED